MEIQALMERRVMGNCHARCGPGENLEDYGPAENFV